MSGILVIKMNDVESVVCKQVMNGKNAEVLLDVITDRIVLSDSLSAEEAKGAGRVLKFLRSLHNEGENLIETPKS